MSTREEYGAALAAKLEKAGISQTELAEKLGIHRSAVSRWLSTTRKTLVLPSLASIQNIEWAIESILAKRAKSRAVQV